MGAEVDLADSAVWRDELVVQKMFARLREQEPVSWQFEDESRTAGYWAVASHRHVVEVATDPGRFSSAFGTSIRTLPAEISELIGSMLNMDDPRHAQLRRVVTRAFAGRSVRGLEHHIRTVADRLVARALACGGGDVVTDIAKPLPLTVMCDMLGIPEEHRAQVAVDCETLGVSREHGDIFAAAQRLHDVAARLAVSRRTTGGDDLVSALVHANVDGESLTPAQIGSFFLLLASAGTQTTQHAISGGVVALDEHRDALERWCRDPETTTATAVEEIVRWVAPIRHFRRTATRTTDLAGTPISEGDKVVIWYTSANRDESVFDGADRFDVTRDPNPHLGYGIGPHSCLGAMLARQEIAAVFEAILRRGIGYQVTGVETLASRFVAGHRRVLWQW